MGKDFGVTLLKGLAERGYEMSLLTQSKGAVKVQTVSQLQFCRDHCAVMLKVMLMADAPQLDTALQSCDTDSLNPLLPNVDLGQDHTLSGIVQYQHEKLNLNEI